MSDELNTEKQVSGRKTMLKSSNLWVNIAVALGIVCLVGGAFWHYPPLGVIIAGGFIYVGAVRASIRGGDDESG